MKVKHPYAVVIMAISISMLMTRTAVTVHEKQVLRENCEIEVSSENWNIISHITTSGEVSPENVQKASEIIKTQVPVEAWNFLINSGGKLIIVDGDDIKGYIAEHYNRHTTIEEKVIGYCARNYDIDFVGDVKMDLGVLQSVDIIVAEDCLDNSLVHEFCHGYDYSHGFSKTEEFQDIFVRASTIITELGMGERAVEYYGGSVEEFFAEMSAKYIRGEIVGVDAELENYLMNVLN